MRKLVITLLAFGLIAGAMVWPQPGYSSAPSAIRFQTYRAPEGQPGARGAGETSIGVVKATNDAMFEMGAKVSRVRWDDEGDATWTDVSYTPTATISLDPILWTDPETDRTFVTQLLGTHSAAAYTDDAGASWTPMQPPTVAPSFDHQTIGGGPYRLTPPNPLYPHAMYYCAQGLVVAQCARSDNGGLTWGAPVPTGTGCSAIHGHVEVGPDGSVYVPRGACGSRQGYYVSRDDGLTWTAVGVPGTDAAGGIRDPKIDFDGDGRMYFVSTSDGRPVVVTSPDNGVTWDEPTDVGRSFDIRNTEFVAVVAGDGGRAAFSFFGTPTPGNDQAADFDGVWHQYVAYTFDGGANWQTVDATPTDPVQRGCIWLGGGSNACRNLLDFQDATVDAEGRVLVSYADGCISAACVAPSGKPSDSRSSYGTISRQASGRRLYAAFDPTEPDPLDVSTSGPYMTSLDSPVVLHALPVGGTLPYDVAWDLDDDGAFDDASGPDATFTPAAIGSFPVSVKVTDGDSSSVTASTTVTVSVAHLFDDTDTKTFAQRGRDGFGQATPSAHADVVSGDVSASASASDTFPVAVPHNYLVGNAEAEASASVLQSLQVAAGRYRVSAVLNGVSTSLSTVGDGVTGRGVAALNAVLSPTVVCDGGACPVFSPRPVEASLECPSGCGAIEVFTLIDVPHAARIDVSIGLHAIANASGTSSADASAEGTVASISVTPA